MIPLDRIQEDLAALQIWAEEGKPLPFIDEGQDFIVGEPMAEAELSKFENDFEVSLPPEYRSFLQRFGDARVGPGQFRRLGETLTARSKRAFPLQEPFLGCFSVSHQELSQQRQSEEFGRLLQRWQSIPKEDGILAITDYGCAIYGVLILNGAHRGQVWIQHGDSAYYGPFGGSELLHDESASADWKATDHPREYSFFEWYESWLNIRMKMAGLLPW